MKEARSLDNEQWGSLIGEMDAHPKAHSIPLESSDIKLSGILSVDGKTEQFVGIGSATFKEKGCACGNEVVRARICRRRLIRYNSIESTYTLLGDEGVDLEDARSMEIGELVIGRYGEAQGAQGDIRWSTA